MLVALSRPQTRIEVPQGSEGWPCGQREFPPSESLLCGFSTRVKQRSKIDSFLGFANLALLGERLYFGDFRRRKPEIHCADDAVHLL